MRRADPAPQYLWRRKPTLPVWRCCGVPNPLWRKPTHPVWWCCGVPTRSVIFSNMANFWLYLHHTFVLLALKGQVLLYPFFHSVAETRVPSRANFPETSHQVPGRAGSPGSSSHCQASTSFDQGQLKSSCSLKTFYRFTSALPRSLNELTSRFWLLLSSLCRQKFWGHLLLPEQGQAQDLSGNLSGWHPGAQP